jgi:hypothetical protein
MRPRGFAIAFALALITSATAHAAPVIATTVEGAEHSGALSRLDARTVELQDGETTRTLSWDEITALTFDDALNAAANPRQAAFYLADGGRLTGTLIAGDAAGVGVRGEQAVDWENPMGPAGGDPLARWRRGSPRALRENAGRSAHRQRRAHRAPRKAPRCCAACWSR